MTLVRTLRSRRRCAFSTPGCAVSTPPMRVNRLWSRSARGCFWPDSSRNFPARHRSDDQRPELRSVETSIDTAGGDQLVVATFLGDARFVDHHDAVGMLDRG